MSKGILQVHPPICDCPGCRISSPVNRGRLAEKRTIPLPPTRVPKKELSSIFSHSEDSEESDKSNGQPPEVKQEEDLHISIMKRRIHTHWDLNISFRETSCSRDSDLSTIISNLHQSRQLVMPESQSRCEFKRNSLDVGLAAADEILGKRRVCSPNSSSECPLESKKARSESPKENSHTPVLEEAVAQMTPEEHYRRMMSALNEHGAFEEQQQQRLYQLANSMAVPSHGGRAGHGHSGSAASGRQLGNSHIPSASNSSSQRRKQGLPQHRDSHFPDREISHPPPLLSPQNAPHIALGPHLRPPFLGVPSALCQTPGYGFLQPAQAEMFARQQEMLPLGLLPWPLSRSNPSPSPGAAPGLPGAVQGSGSCPRSGAAAAGTAREKGVGKWEGKCVEMIAEPLAAPCAGSAGSEHLMAAITSVQIRSFSCFPGCARGFLGSVWGSAPFPAPSLGPGAGCCLCGILMIYVPFSSPPSNPPTPNNPGTMGGLFLDGEESPALEDISKWTVEDVCSFVSNLSGCTEYTQVFREQAIDGETLPLLTEEHLLNNMGLKLGPALKIRSQVAKRLGRVLYMAGFPLALPLQPPGLRPPEREVAPGELRPASTGSVASPFGSAVPASRGSPKQENGNPSLLGDTTKAPS
uniref:Sterile alpha motif domain containing 11 n=1 Tax=Cyanistes caeruleus TaxID=156563 RepID=A0A8C0VJ73_CYACU